MPEKPEPNILDRFLRWQYFTYFKSNLILWALKLLTLKAISLKRIVGGSAPPAPPPCSQSFAPCSPLHNSFIWSFTPHFKELEPPLIIGKCPFGNSHIWESAHLENCSFRKFYIREISHLEILHFRSCWFVLCCPLKFSKENPWENTYNAHYIRIRHTLGKPSAPLERWLRGFGEKATKLDVSKSFKGSTLKNKYF